MNNTTNNSPIIRLKYYCENCDYSCSKKSDFNKHIKSIKHNTTDTTKIQRRKSPNYLCSCGKIYTHRALLFNHKKKCTYVPL